MPFDSHHASSWSPRIAVVRAPRRLCSLEVTTSIRAWSSAPRSRMNEPPGSHELDERALLDHRPEDVVGVVGLVLGEGDDLDQRRRPGHPHRLAGS
jgi:hypothetical protein